MAVKVRHPTADRRSVESISINDLRRELAELEAQAAKLSQMRSHLHHQIDFGFETGTTRERDGGLEPDRACE